jgi:hypothetical protein
MFDFAYSFKLRFSNFWFLHAVLQSLLAMEKVEVGLQQLLLHLRLPLPLVVVVVEHMILAWIQIWTRSWLSLYGSLWRKNELGKKQP